MLIEKCLSTCNPILDLGYCTLHDGDLEPGSIIGSALAKCTQLTTLILSNETRHWNLNETTVLMLRIGCL